MWWQNLPFMLPLLLASATAAILAVAAWRYRRAPVVRPFALLMLAVAEWSLGYSFELASVSLAVKVFWAKMQYLGIVIAPLAWVLFALRYTKRETWLTARSRALLAILPLVTLLLVWTNEFHHLIWSNLQLESAGPFLLLDLSHGVWFWVNTTYAYLLLLSGTILLLQVLRRPLYRGQAIALLIGLLAPWAGNALYLSGLSPLPQLDLTPFALTLTGLAVTLGLLRFRLFDILPLARDAVIEGMRDGVIMLDEEGRVVDLNPAAQRILGQPGTGMIGRLAGEAFAPWPRLADLCQDGGEAPQEIVLTGKDDLLLHYQLRTTFLRDRRSRPLGRLAVLHDITAFRQAEEALQESEQKYRTLVEQSLQGAAIIQGVPPHLVFANRALGEIFGCSVDELLSLAPEQLLSFLPPEDQEIFVERYRGRLLGRETPPRYEFRILRRDGTVRWVEMFATRIDYRGESAVHATFVDITERRRTEEQARRQAEMLETLQRTSLQLTSSLDLNTVLNSIAESALQLVNASNCHIYLYDEATRSLTFGVALWKNGRREAAVSAPRSDGLTARVAQGREVIVINDAAQHPFFAAPEARLWGIQAIAGFPLKRAGQVRGVFTIAFLTPHTFSEEELRVLRLLADQAATAIENARLYDETARLKAFNESIVQGVAEAILIENAEGLVTFANPAAEELLGYGSEELAGLHWGVLVPLEERETVRQESARRGQGIGGRYETVLLTRKGQAVPVIVSARPLFEGTRFVGVLSALTDISERKRLEEQLRQAQKMEAVGRLAGGVAHDFNNLLLAISGYTEFILEALDADDPMRRDAEAVLQAADRATRLTQQLLAFGRRQVLELQVINLNRVLQNLEGMLRRIIGEDIEFLLIPDPGLGSVRVDLSQMEQVIVNLVINAREAMPRGGRLILETSNAELDEAYAQQNPAVGPGSYVRLTVSDTGRGMAPEVQEHLFEPFFTTKDGGTGLGLATVYGIVNQFGGHIQVYSEMEEGTTFQIYLPRVEEPAPPAESMAVFPGPVQGAETILVVEDNEVVRHMVTRALSEQGYTVLEAQGGAQALRAAREHTGPIDLLLTDVVMPEMSGQALAAALQQFLPGVRVLYMSGYADTVIAQHGVLDPGVAFIGKPFTPQALARKVRTVLDGP